MKKLLFLIALFYGLKVNAQNYLITFTGTGESTTVSTVKVENLAKGTSLTLNGGDVLRLTLVTGVNSIYENQTSEIKTYPNPVIDNATVEIFPPVAGNAVVTVFDMNGRPVGLLHGYLENSRQDFWLTGLKTGFYLVSVRGNNYQFSGSILSYGKSGGTVRLEKISNVVYPVYEKAAKTEVKGSQTTVDMEYSIGDRLKFTGISGIYSTVKTDIPTSDKIINFNFIACTDADNNNYSVVEIGSQVWMAENLKTIRFNDGTLIPSGLNNWWASTPKYCWYDNDSVSYKDVYGALYNWATVNDLRNGNKNVCPTGWHVPDALEWLTLTDNASGGQLKETGFTHWFSPNAEASNETGFTALPGGYCAYSGYFQQIGLSGNYWTSAATWLEVTRGYSQIMSSVNGKVTGQSRERQEGLSVRCIHGEIVLATITTSAVTSVTIESAISGGTISAGYGNVSSRGICLSKTPNPIHPYTGGQENECYGCFGTKQTFRRDMSGLTPNTTYYLRAYYVRDYGGMAEYGTELIFKTYAGKVTDVEGNKYNTITIGDQLWMAENLKTTKYNDSTSIPLINDNAEWAEISDPGYCWYNNNPATNKTTYGALYNWFVLDPASNGHKNVCPELWQVPTDEDLTKLANYLADNGYGYQGVESDIAKSMAAVSGWTLSSSRGSPGYDTSYNNFSGFTALPGGYRNIDGTFDNIMHDGYWWSSTDSWYRNISSDYSKVYRGQWGKTHGFSVRCIHGPHYFPTSKTVAVTYTIQNTATVRSVVISEGGLPVTARGVCWSTIYHPTIANNKTINGTGIGSFSSSLTGLAPNTYYNVRAYATNSLGTEYGNELRFYTATVTDIDGNVYPTVTIGKLTWMAENLKVTKFRSGMEIQLATTNAVWSQLEDPISPIKPSRYCWYNNDIKNKNVYGAIYNYWVVNNSGYNVCPVGWLVPSGSDWSELSDYLGGTIEAGGKIKETGYAHWESPNTGASNESGFTGVAAGLRSAYGTFIPPGRKTSWWSTGTESNWSVFNDNTVLIPLGSSLENKYNGYSIRCIKW